MSGTTSGPEDARGGHVLDFKQAQEFLNTTRTTLYRWIAQGRIRAFKAGRQWRMYRADLEEFLRSPDPSAQDVDQEAVRVAIDAISRWQVNGRLVEGGGPGAAMYGEDGVAVLAEQVMLAAQRHGASDVHLDPVPEGGRLRLRVDGVLRAVADLPPGVFIPLVARLKEMAGMEVADHASTQLGRIRGSVGEGGPLHCRAQTLPTPHGEKLTLRVLKESAWEWTLDDIGFSDADRERLGTALGQPCGLILFGGPTGSGKTTVLYAALRHVLTDGISIMTAESTVDYLLPGTVQVQTNPRAGLTTAGVLRSILRSDPDVIVVGEMPDRETATLAVEAALTGHLVLVQMHASDAVGNINRLLGAGVEPFLLASALLASSNQRLVRRVCEGCRQELPVDPQTLAEWRARAEAGGLVWPDEAVFYEGRGCDACRGVGYKGRTAIYEVLMVDSRIAQLITAEAEAKAILEAAVGSGMTTLFADGMRKALAGVTSPIDVARVCDPAWLSA